MRNIVLKYGIISGMVLATMVFVMSAIVGDSTDFERGESLGYFFIVCAFLSVFFGIRTLRDKHYDGKISFNKAFRTGLLITIVACSMYVVAWMIHFNYIDDTFIERYTEYYINKVQESGRSAEEIEKEINAFKVSMSNYNNPIVMSLYTFLEVFPVGLVISILCAFLMKKKPQPIS